MKEKSLRRVRNQEKMTTFAKNTAHNERRLLNFSYLCNVADNPSQTCFLMLKVESIWQR